MEWESSVLELMFLDCCKKNNRSFQVCECRPPFWDDLLLKVESFTVYGDCVLHMHKLIQLFLAMQTWFICIRISAVYVGRICCIFKCMYAYWCICMIVVMQDGTRSNCMWWKSWRHLRQSSVYNLLIFSSVNTFFCRLLLRWWRFIICFRFLFINLLLLINTNTIPAFQNSRLGGVLKVEHNLGFWQQVICQFNCILLN